MPSCLAPEGATVHSAAGPFPGSIAAVPEPGSLALVGLALMGGGVRWRGRRTDRLT